SLKVKIFLIYILSCPYSLPCPSLRCARRSAPCHHSAQEFHTTSGSRWICRSPSGRESRRSTLSQRKTKRDRRPLKCRSVSSNLRTRSLVHSLQNQVERLYQGGVCPRHLLPTKHTKYAKRNPDQIFVFFVCFVGTPA